MGGPRVTVPIKRRDLRRNIRGEEEEKEVEKRSRGADLGASP